MKRWMLGLLAVLFSTTLAAAQQQPPTPVMPQPGEIPQIVAFDNDGLLGDHIHIFGDTPDLGKWGNSISSMVIVAGRWELFDEVFEFQWQTIRHHFEVNEQARHAFVGGCSPALDNSKSTE